MQSDLFCFIFAETAKLMYFSVSRLIIRNISTITGNVVVLRCHIFPIPILSSLYILILLYFLTDMLLSVGTAIAFRRHDFFNYP